MAQDTASPRQAHIDLLETMQAAPLSPFHISLAILLALILWFDGYDLYNAAYIVHDVAPLWHLSPSQVGVLLSCGLAGFALGSVVSGLFGDRMGDAAYWSRASGGRA